MTVYILVREDQSEHGYTDTSIMGVYPTRAAADVACSEERKRAVAAGERLADEDGNEGIWTVGLKVEEHEMQPDLTPAQYAVLRLAELSTPAKEQAHKDRIAARWHLDEHGGTRYAVDLLGPIAAKEIKMLGWQQKGLSYTATGYGSEIPTSRVIYFTEKNGKIGRPRRVYATQYSNAGTCWVKVQGKRAIVREQDLA